MREHCLLLSSMVHPTLAVLLLTVAVLLLMKRLAGRLVGNLRKIIGPSDQPRASHQRPMEAPLALMVRSTADRDREAEPKHKIFLSYSGAQRNFVDQLQHDFEGRDRYPFFDIRRSSLPVGEEAQENIFDAIKESRVGVLILTREFFTRTEWPMLELVAMVREYKKPNLRMTIIPVYLGISWSECNDHTPDWIAQWERWAKTHKDNEDERMKIDVEVWKEALDTLSRMQGLSLKADMLERNFRTEIVEAVCKLVPPETRADDSYIVGKERLCEEVLKVVNSKDPDRGVRVVGLYGMRGSGKTTLCQALCNKLCTEFRDKVCHFEFGSGSEGKLLLNVLKSLSDMKPEILEKLSEEACFRYLKGEMLKNRVFLAIDGITDDIKSIHQARALKEASFGNGSVVLMSSSSKDILSKALAIDESDCLEIPDLQKDEAKDLFLDNAVPRDIPRNEVSEELVLQCLKRCLFDKGGKLDWHFHPFAIRVLGQQLRYAHGYDPQRWKADLQKIETLNLLRKQEHPIFSIFNLSFDSLLREDQLLFMDIALFSPAIEPVPNLWGFSKDRWLLVPKPERSSAMFTDLEWLGLAHAKTTGEIRDMVEGLERKALLNTQVGGSIGMHALWREFAVFKSEDGVEEDRRWIFEPDVHSGQWKRCGKAHSMHVGFGSWKGSKTLNLSRFPEVAVMRIGDVPLGLTLDMTGLEDLKSLEVIIRRFNFPEEDKDDQRAHVQANILDAIQELYSGLSGITGGYVRSLKDIITKRPIFLKVEFIERERTLLENWLEYLNKHFNKLLKGSLGRYQEIVNDHVERLEVVMNGSNAQLRQSMDVIVKEHLKGLEASIDDVLKDHLKTLDANINHVLDVPLKSVRANIEEQLKSLEVSIKDHLETLATRVKDISNDQLQLLETSVNRRGGEVSIKDHLETLETRVKDISNDQLQLLETSVNRRGGESSGLGVIGSRIVRIEALRLACGSKHDPIPLEIRGLRALENLTFLRCWNVAWSACMEDIGSLTNLEFLDLNGFQGDKLPDFSKLTNLRYLNLRECESLQSVDLRGLTKLEVLDVEFSYPVRKLDLSGCRSLREVWGLGRKESLEELNLSGCHRLSQFPKLRKCRRLRELHMRECWQIQSLPGLRHLRSLRILDITGCFLIRELRELSGNVSLEVVRAKGCKKLAELPNMRNLVELDIEPSTVMLREGEDEGGGGEVEDEEEEDDGYKYFYLDRGTGHLGLIFPLWLQDVPEIATWDNVVTLRWAPTGDEEEAGASSASASLLASE